MFKIKKHFQLKLIFNIFFKLNMILKKNVKFIQYLMSLIDPQTLYQIKILYALIFPLFHR